VHTFWLALIVPAVLLSQWIWPVLRIRSIWSISTIIVAVVTLGWLAMGLVNLPTDQQNPMGVLMLAAFRFLSFTDLPLVQLLIGCAVGWLSSDRKNWE